jgi:hypothetical protein
MPTEIEQRFHEAMVGIYRLAKSEADYNATRYVQMVSDHGGLAPCLGSALKCYLRADPDARERYIGSFSSKWNPTDLKQRECYTKRVEQGHSTDILHLVVDRQAGLVYAVGVGTVHP